MVLPCQQQFGALDSAMQFLIRWRLVSFLACLLTLPACKPEARKQAAPAPAAPAELKRWSFAENGVVFDADFPRARVNGCEALGNGEYELVIRPEDSPINNSPWFAFK